MPEDETCPTASKGGTTAHENGTAKAGLDAALITIARPIERQVIREAFEYRNRTHSLRALLSGLIFSGSCRGRYVMRGQGLYACSTHVMNDNFANSRSIARTVLEERVLAGLRERLMAPKVEAETMRL